MFQSLKGGCKEDGDSVFTKSHMEKMRANAYELLLGRLQLVTRGKFFTINHWNELPRKVVDSPTLDIVNIQLGRGLGNLILTTISQ